MAGYAAAEVDGDVLPVVILPVFVADGELPNTPLVWLPVRVVELDTDDVEMLGEGPLKER